MTTKRLLSTLATIAVVSSIGLPAMAAVQSKNTGAQTSSSSSSSKKSTSGTKKSNTTKGVTPTSDQVISLAAGTMCTYEKKGLCDIFHCDDGSTLNTCNLVRDAIKQKTEFWYGADGLSFWVHDSDECDLKYSIHPGNHEMAQVQSPICPKYQPSSTPSNSSAGGSSCVEISYMTIPGTPLKKGMSLCYKMCPGKPAYIGMCS